MKLLGRASNSNRWMRFFFRNSITRIFFGSGITHIFFLIFIWPIFWLPIQFLSRIKLSHLANVGIELPLLALVALGWNTFNQVCRCAQLLDNLKRPNKLRHEFRCFPLFLMVRETSTKSPGWKSLAHQRRLLTNFSLRCWLFLMKLRANFRYKMIRR